MLARWTVTTGSSRARISDPDQPRGGDASGVVYKLFNNQFRTGQDTAWSGQQQDASPDTIYDPNQASSNENYGRITSRQDPRLFRAAIRVAF